MSIEIKQLKKLILPTLLFISISFTLLYLFGIIDFKTGHEPENQFLKFNFIDSPIPQEKIHIYPETIADTTGKELLKIPDDSLKQIY
jgi:hypothetical protein